METKFTPGPWDASERGDYSDFEGNSRVICGDDMRIAVVHTDGREEFEANAHLIAAAPDLYEALEEVERVYGHFGDAGPYEFPDDHHMTRVRAALAKARGETA